MEQSFSCVCCVCGHFGVYQGPVVERRRCWGCVWAALGPLIKRDLHGVARPALFGSMTEHGKEDVAA